MEIKYFIIIVSIYFCIKWLNLHYTFVNYITFVLFPVNLILKFRIFKFLLLTEDSIFKSLILLRLNYIFPFLMFTSIYFSFQCQYYSALLSQHISTAEYFKQYDFKIIFTSAKKSTLYSWKINLYYIFDSLNIHHITCHCGLFHTSYDISIFKAKIFEVSWL